MPPGWLPPLLLLLPAWVTITTSATRCGLDKFENSLGVCCDLCPAGHYVSRECDSNHITECHLCEHGTFMAHRNMETDCLPCSQCREDEEVVTPCSPESDQQCQCRQGAFYCDSELCRENCYRCSRCKGAVLQACNATRDTICATETKNPGSGNPNVYWWVLLVLGIFVITVTVIACKKRKPIFQISQISEPFVAFLKENSSEQGCHPSKILRTLDPERGTPGVKASVLLAERASALAPAAGTCPEPSEDLENGIERQVLVAEGQAAPEEEEAEGNILIYDLIAHRGWAVAEGSEEKEEVEEDEDGTRTGVPSSRPYNPLAKQWKPVARLPLARGPAAPAAASASLADLEQEYKRMFGVRDPSSSDDDTRIFYEFEHSIPEKDWKMFVRLVGLKENDIEMCEHENPGNLMEQRHQMLRRWKDKRGREASVFRLLAALRKMERQTHLQNIVNRLLAEKILVKSAEAPN
ncbi:uncharacterized protein LOC107503231 isoform X2 [Rousettus aegyptiacus]|nr:uncharacterized protein LOC107503231 isoform X2 [Rousettus aegyptiacus]